MEKIHHFYLQFEDGLVWKKNFCFEFNDMYAYILDILKEMIKLILREEY